MAVHVHDDDDEGMRDVSMVDVADARVVAAHVDDDGDVHVSDDAGDDVHEEAKMTFKMPCGRG